MSIISIEPLFNDDTEEDIINYAEKSGNCFPYILTIANGYDLDIAIGQFNNDEHIIAADKNYLFELESPNISDSSATYENNNRSTNSSQWVYNYLEMDTVRSYGFVGSDDFIVAVIDRAFGLQHEDLIFDVENAYNASDESSNVTGSDEHGNIVSGIIGAENDNGIGIDGICKNVTLLPISINTGSSAVFIRALSKSIAKGAKVITCAVTLPFQCDLLIINGIANAGVLVVTAAGNGMNGTGTDMINHAGTLAARNSSPYWIVVGASTEEDEKWNGSNFSAMYCDLFAPGHNITTTTLTGYVTTSGTSLSTPIVAAACALIWSKATYMSALEVKSIIFNNVRTIDEFNNYCVTSGILSMKNAAEAVYNAYRGAYTKGDVTGDGYVTAADATACKSIYLGQYEGTPTAAQLEAADVNNNGQVDSRDYVYLTRYCNKTYYFIP